MERIGSVSVLLLVALVGAACGDDGGERAEVAWADSVCGAGLEFLESIPSDLDELVSAGLALDETRDDLVAATEKLVDDLSATELPESDQVEAAQAEIDSILESAEAIGDSLSDDDADLSDLISSIPGEVDSVVSSIERLQDLDVLGELQSGIEDSEVCQELLGES